MHSMLPCQTQTERSIEITAEDLMLRKELEYHSSLHFSHTLLMHVGRGAGHRSNDTMRSGNGDLTPRAWTPFRGASVSTQIDLGYRIRRDDQ